MKSGLTQTYIQIDPKTLYYRNDGTGRDTYIGNFSGGFFSQNHIEKIKPKIKISFSPLYFTNPKAQ